MTGTQSDQLIPDPTAEAPIRRWTAKVAPRPGKRRTALKQVSWTPDGWPSDRPNGKVCRSIFDPNRTECSGRSVWCISITRGHIIGTSYWCDRHLPDEDRPADSESTTPERLF